MSQSPWQTDVTTPEDARPSFSPAIGFSGRGSRAGLTQSSALTRPRWGRCHQGHAPYACSGGVWSVVVRSGGGDARRFSLSVGLWGRSPPPGAFRFLGGCATSLRSLGIHPLESPLSPSVKVEPLTVAAGNCSPTFPRFGSRPIEKLGPTLPTFLAEVSPFSPLKCQITYGGSSWNPLRKIQAAPRVGKYRFRILPTPAPLSVFGMWSRPSFPDAM